jgi:catechol 2,3-dioxygenase-like lactoylglutathione lyase family enzyme
MHVRFELTTLLVDDLARMKSFYVNAFGFEAPVEKAGFVELETRGARLALYPREAFATLTGDAARPGISVTLGFHCDDRRDVETAFERAIRQGARSVREPAPTQWKRFAAFVADPEGHVIELSCAMPDAPL